VIAMTASAISSYTTNLLAIWRNYASAAIPWRHMSNSQDTTRLLAQLVGERRTGCLTVDSADGRVCRVYLLMGKVFHAEGADTEGEPALAEAKAWPDVTLSFDDRAKLPSKQTIDVNASTTASASAPSAAIDRLSSDPGILRMSCISIGGVFLLVAVPIVFIVIAAIRSGRNFGSDGFAAAAVIAFSVLLFVWLAGFIGLRVVFFRDAVRISDDASGGDIPLVVESADGVISGEPELIIKMRTRSTVGKLGRCDIELYANGLQISKGPQSPTPRWQFAYRDLVQAEEVDLITNSTRGSSHQYFLRLITAQPRMAFLFGNAWLRNGKTHHLIQKLREHKVPTFDESIDT
jgi:hypothetical protein